MLFAFGDSYADTGNSEIAVTRSWKFPYGITFPGKPSGRFSDGFVSTDYIGLVFGQAASYLGMKTPVPYRWRKQVSGRVKDGMNMAYGGTGVFQTLISGPNMTTQIDFLKQLLDDSVYTPRDLKTSVAHVSLSGNDYSTYYARNGSVAGLQAFIESVVKQLMVNLKRIQELGVRRIGVSSLLPLGCIPLNTARFSFQRCNQTDNVFVQLHNHLLLQAVNTLNQQTNRTSFFVLDLYNAVDTILGKNQSQPGSPRFENPLEPCCFGVSEEFECGSVDENGEKKYRLCSNPKSKFFWDGEHPSSQGWRAVYLSPAFQDTLKQFL
ncbi:GDSL esterase/lipase [Hibiscus syriacus]|uniref:GDSL esterase/lipase n=1 Tax=Hibiscus syriacus TaxID=106335 RepID=A0A6A2ZG54_HIBSY|nr:GDSL esterase/lipase [Hibiscus syriacus]